VSNKSEDCSSDKRVSFVEQEEKSNVNVTKKANKLRVFIVRGWLVIKLIMFNIL